MFYSCDDCQWLGQFAPPLMVCPQCGSVQLSRETEPEYGDIDARGEYDDDDCDIDDSPEGKSGAY